jgi:CHAT domain-containing protein/tetratricopeptide (TPR) repeat protein
MQLRRKQRNWNIPIPALILIIKLCLVGFLIPLAAVGLNSTLRSHTNAVHPALQEARHLSNTIQKEKIPYLTSDKLIQRKIAPGELNLYHIELASGQFFQVFLETQDEHISMAVFNPDHRKIYDVNSRRFKTTSLSLIAEVSGSYTLELQSLEVDGDAASYELRVDAVRKAIASDRDFIAAEKSFAAAIKLRAEWTSEALLNAINKYEAAYNYWHSISNQQQMIETLTNIGEAYSRLSQNQKALDYYNQALLLSRAIGNRQSEVDLLNDIGEINIDLGNRQITLDYCKQSLALSVKVGYVRGQAQALNNIGLVYHVLSDMQKALDSLNQALSLWRAAGDRRGQAQTLTNIGYSYNDLGDLRRALAIFDEALALWQKSGDLRGATLTLTAIGLLYSSLGDMQRALDAHDKAAQFFQKMGDKSGEAVTLNALAYVYDTLDDKDKALNCYKKAVQLYKAAGRRSSEAVTMGLIGEIYDSLGDKQKALDFYKKSLEISRSLGDHRAEAYALKDIGDIFVYFGEKDKALDYFKRALSLSQSLSDLRGQAYVLNSTGYVYEMSGQKQKALDYYKQAIALNRATEDRAGEAQTLHNITSVARDLGDLKDAYDQGKALLSIVETLRTKVASQDLRASYFASAHQHYELYIDILMRLHRQDPAAGYAAAALEASERARGRVLLDLLNEARADIRQGLDPALLQQERDLQQLLNAKAERQVRLLSDAHTDEQAAAIKKEVADITSRYEQVLAQIRATSRRYATLTQPRTLSLPEIQRQLMDADTMLLEYSLGDERSYLWAVTSASATAYELPGRNKIEGAAIRLYRSLTAYSEPQRDQSPQQRRNALVEEDSQYSQAAVELTKILLEPIASHLAAKRLVIVADGVLQYVPFAALPDPNDVKQGKYEQQPLVVNHEIINLPSISIVSALRSEIKERSPAPKALAVLADPVFEKDDPRVNLKRRTSKSGVNTTSARLNTSRGQQPMRSDAPENMREKLHFQRLPFSSGEAMAIANLVPEQERRVALGFDASLSTAKSAELQQYRILHFATHGLIYGVHPQLYGVVLSLVDRQGNSQDGFLRLNEIYNLKLAADLVVLSACQTALGKDIKGEGLVGIARGFMYAGAARVVASLWKVDDRASAELMKYFYDGLFGQPRLRPAAALRAAQVKMWKQLRWRSPYFWAAFMLQGEWK